MATMLHFVQVDKPSEGVGVVGADPPALEEARVGGEDPQLRSKRSGDTGRR